MIRIQNNPHSNCQHESTDSMPGTSGFGLERTVCTRCRQVFVQRTAPSEPGVLFKKRPDAALLTDGPSSSTGDAT